MDRVTVCKTAHDQLSLQHIYNLDVVVPVGRKMLGCIVVIKAEMRFLPVLDGLISAVKMKDHTFSCLCCACTIPDPVLLQCPYVNL